MTSDYIKLIATNKKARHNYAIESEYEAGIVLVGSEVKSIREGRVSFQDAYADIKNGELLASGKADDIKNNKQVREGYLGEDFVF